MAHALGLKLNPDLLAAFNGSSGSTHRALKVRIESETFVLAGTVPSQQSDDEQEFARVKDAFIAPAEACFVLFANTEQIWHLFSFVPDDAPVRDKMLYSSSRSVLLKSLGGGERIPRDAHWTGPEDVALPNAISETDRRAEQESVMTAVEKMKIEADRHSAAEAASGKITSIAGLNFPFTSEATAGLDAFKLGSLACLILAIEAETIVQRASAAPAAAAPASVQALLPPAAPCYVLYRWAHERNGASASSVLFLFMCPEDAPIRDKMVHASTKTPFVTALSDLGIAKSIEGLEASELTEAELTKKLYEDGARADEPKVVTKAAPRGGRRLVKKPAAAAAEIS